MKYNLSASSGAAHKRWGALEPLDDGMIAMKAAVAAAIASGLFYTKDVYAKVAPQFEFTEEELEREVGRVERGVVGMEIYYARRAVEADKLAIDKAEALKALNLSVGEKLPAFRLIIQGKGYRWLRSAVVKSINDGWIVLSVTIGNKKGEVTVSPISLREAKIQNRIAAGTFAA